MSSEIYWIAEIPCGRLAILGRPCAGELLRDEITSGLTDVVSLLEDHEVRELELTQQNSSAMLAWTSRDSRFPTAGFQLRSLALPNR